MKFSAVFCTALALGVTTAQDGGAPSVPSDITQVITVTQTAQATANPSSQAGVTVSECGPHALCDINRPPKKVDFYPGTVTSTYNHTIPVTSTVERKVVELVVTVTSIPVATIGLCPTEVITTHSTPKTVVVTQETTIVEYMVTSVTETTLSVLTEFVTKSDACTIRSPLLRDPVVTDIPPTPLPIPGDGQQPLIPSDIPSNGDVWDE